LKDVSMKVRTNVIPATHLWGMFLMMKMRKKKTIEHPSPTPPLLPCNGKFIFSKSSLDGALTQVLLPTHRAGCHWEV